MKRKETSQGPTETRQRSQRVEWHKRLPKPLLKKQERWSGPLPIGPSDPAWERYQERREKHRIEVMDELIDHWREEDWKASDGRWLQTARGKPPSPTARKRTPTLPEPEGGTAAETISELRAENAALRELLRVWRDRFVRLLEYCPAFAVEKETRGLKRKTPEPESVARRDRRDRTRGK